MKVQETPKLKESPSNDVPLKTQRTSGFLLRYELEDFLSAKSQVSVHTLRSYRQKLSKFIEWLEENTEVEELEDLERAHIRAFLRFLQENHAPGGVHFYFRSLRVWIRWAQREYGFED